MESEETRRGLESMGRKGMLKGVNSKIGTVQETDGMGVEGN